MPSIMVVAHTANGDEAAVFLTERLMTRQLEDAHCAAQLLERLKWASEDAERAEREAGDPRPVDGPSAAQVRPQSSPTRGR